MNNQYFKFKYSQPFPEMDIDTTKYYHFVGEIFDEHDNNPNKDRNTELIENQFCKIKMKNHHSAIFLNNVFIYKEEYVEVLNIFMITRKCISL